MKHFLCWLLGHRMPKPIREMLQGAIVANGVAYTCDRCGERAYEWRGQ